jgi:NADH-ubiquinone oxidoreductase chain 5
MFLFCGCSHYSISFFHLFNHAYFKALLFLCAGVLIHSLLDEQDIRRFGSFFRLAPLIYLCFLIGSFAICGFPFLTGFYSKDLLSELSLIFYFDINPLFFVSLCSISIFFTSVYTIRLLIYCFFTTVSFTSMNILHHPDTFYLSLSVLFFLALCSLVVGYIFFDIFTESFIACGGFV